MPSGKIQLQKKEALEAKREAELAIGQSKELYDGVFKEHSRLMGLAGTPEFYSNPLEGINDDYMIIKPDCIINNIHRITVNWSLFKEEREKFETTRDSVLDERTKEILADNLKLKKQVSDLQRTIRQLERLKDILVETIKSFGEQIASKILEKARSIWATDKLNPKQEEPKSPPPPSVSSGPSM